MMSVEEAKSRLRNLGEEVDARNALRRRQLLSPAMTAGLIAVAGGLLLGRRKKGAKSMMALVVLGRLLRPAIPVIARAALGGVRTGRVKF